MVDIVRQNFQQNKKLYNKIAKELKNKLESAYPITHVGSTAIPDMYGKNIIDILIGVKNNKEFEDVADKLINIGYFESKKNKDDVYRFFSSTDAETSSGDIHIHLGIIETQKYNEFIILKNYLLSNKTEANDYSSFKKDIIKKRISDRKEYKVVKSKYVSNLLLRAKKHYNKYI